MSDDDQKDERPSEPVEDQTADAPQKVTEETKTVTEPAETPSSDE